MHAIAFGQLGIELGDAGIVGGFEKVYGVAIGLHRVVFDQKCCQVWDVILYARGELVCDEGDRD